MNKHQTQVIHHWEYYVSDEQTCYWLKSEVQLFKEIIEIFLTLPLKHQAAEIK